MKQLSLACILALLTSCALPSLDVMPRYGQLDVDGDIGAALSGTTLLTNDIKDVGIEDDDGYPGVLLDLDFGSPHFIFMGQNSIHDGDGVLSQDITLDGTTITAGTAVATDFDLGIYSFLGVFDLVPTDKVDVGLGLGVTVLDLDMEIADTMSTNSIATDESLPLPVLAGQVAVQLTKRIGVGGTISGIAVDIDGDDVAYVDADMYGRLTLFREGKRGRGSLVLGYRWIDLDIEYDDDTDVVDLDMTFSGPYLGLELSF